MEITNAINKESELALAIKYYRLKFDLEKAKKKILENTPLDKDEKDGFWKKVKTNFKNNSRERRTSEYNEKLDIINKNIAEFEARYGNKYDESRFGSLQGKINAYFTNDKYGLSKVLFSISVILDKEFEYQFLDDEFTQLSYFIFQDYTKMKNISERLENHYKNIRGKKLTQLQKDVLVGVGIGCAVAFVACPILVVGTLSASAATTTAALAALGFGDMQLGVGLVALYSLLTGLALFGATKLSFDINNILEAKKEFRKLDCNESALFLSIKALMIEEANRLMPKEELKDELNNILTAVDALRSDLEYMLFVERIDAVNNKEKLIMFNNFNKELIEIFNL